MESSLIIKTRSAAGKVKEKTIGNLNPDTSADTAKTIGAIIGRFSKNSHVSTWRIDKYDLAKESSAVAVQKRTPTLTLTNQHQNGGSGEGTNHLAILWDINYDGDGTLAVGNTSCTVDEYSYYIKNGKLYAHPADDNDALGSCQGTLYALETDTCEAVQVDFSFHS